MDKPLTVWYCDVCGERIKDSKSGYVIWRKEGDVKDKNFKIIHKSICDKKEFLASSPIEEFIGPNGQTELLSFLSLGPIKKLLGQPPYCGIIDFDEFVDFFHRVQTPFYEEARRLFDNPDLLEKFNDSNEVAPYLQDSLREIIAQSEKS